MDFRPELSEHPKQSQREKRKCKVHSCAVRPHDAYSVFYFEGLGDVVLWLLSLLRRQLSSRDSAPPLHAPDLQPLQRDALWRNQKKRITHVSLFFTSCWVLVVPASSHRDYYRRGSEQGWSGPVKSCEHKRALSDGGGGRQSGSSGAPTPLRDRLHPPRRPWAAAWGSWKTRRTAAPGRSTPPWRDHKWKPKRTQCTSTCCWTSVWKVIMSCSGFHCWFSCLLYHLLIDQLSCRKMSENAKQPRTIWSVPHLKTSLKSSHQWSLSSHHTLTMTKKKRI